MWYPYTYRKLKIIRLSVCWGTRLINWHTLSCLVRVSHLFEVRHHLLCLCPDPRHATEETVLPPSKGIQKVCTTQENHVCKSSGEHPITQTLNSPVHGGWAWQAEFSPGSKLCTNRSLLHRQENSRSKWHSPHHFHSWKAGFQDYLDGSTTRPAVQLILDSASHEWKGECYSQSPISTAAAQQACCQSPELKSRLNT